MQLDVIIPTYNRQEMLRGAIDSLLSAEVPSEMEVRVTIVDNNSKDDTRQVVQSYTSKFKGRISYVFEAQQGRSSALNAGIANTSGELVGIIDDDEEIDSEWYRTIFSAFEKDNLDFIGGPYIPRWGAKPPPWLPKEYGGVIGWVDGGNKEVPYDRTYPGILMGGNAVFRRSILDKVGPYSTWLGRTDKGLLSCEDEDMYYRLLAAGGRGMYLPTLIIYHQILPERLTRSYFRRWCFWRGVSAGLLEKTRRQQSSYLLGIPRWHYRKAARGVLISLGGLVKKTGDPAKSFAAELAIWDLLGLLYGRHFKRISNKT